MIPADRLPDQIELLSAASAKVVRKPWGEERWLVHGPAPFVMKLIHVRAGQRTSLQFHREKQEANLVLSGRARLHYRRDEGEAVDSCEVGPGSVVYVGPGGVHRIEAVADLTMLEVSTPQVDDVVRVHDDWARADGRIDREHDGEP